MNESLKFLLHTSLLAIGLILCLGALSSLVIYTNGYGVHHDGDYFVAFILASIIGIPILLLGIRKLSV